VLGVTDARPGDTATDPVTVGARAESAEVASPGATVTVPEIAGL
jgi:hypothetical protein